MTRLANQLTDRQWAAACVIDSSPIAFDPLREATRIRDRATECELPTGLREAIAGLVEQLNSLPTIAEQRELLDAISRGES